MDIKRGILLFVFLFSLLTLWNNWNAYNGKAPLFGANPNPVSTTQSGAAPAAGAPAAAVAAAAPAVVPGVTPVAHEDVVITTDVVKATFDTAGGELKRLELLQYKETKSETLWDLVKAKFQGTTDSAPPANVVIFDDTKEHTYLAKTGLVEDAFPGVDAGYTVRPGARTLDNGDTLQVVFDSEKGGVKLTKTFTFKRGQYAIDVKHDVANGTAAAITPSLDLRLVRDGNKPPTAKFAPSPFVGGAEYDTAEKFQTIKFDDIAKKSDKYNRKTNNGWVALIEHFFVSAYVPPKTADRTIYARMNDTTKLYEVGTVLPLGSVAPGATASLSSILYSGPQDSAVLESIAEGLDLTRDYGFFTIVAKPIFGVMNFIHKALGNWGWTIIAFTVLMKILFFPLSAASFRSMAKTKQLAPKVQALRERHKGDPQKLNQATMELYKTEKINPLGGCLPVLVQMPVFIALYSVLQASVETRNAPWIGWIHDLSTPDPLSILPLLMAVSMFVQTKLNPAPPDPVQAKVMMFMPLVFSVMFFMFPSGVVLYYVVNNVLSILQQWIINNKMGAKPAKA